MIRRLVTPMCSWVGVWVGVDGVCVGVDDVGTEAVEGTACAVEAWLGRSGAGSHSPEVAAARKHIATHLRSLPIPRQACMWVMDFVQRNFLQWNLTVTLLF